MPLHISSTCAHHQEVKLALHSIWYHHTYRWPSRAPVHETANLYSFVVFLYCYRMVHRLYLFIFFMYLPIYSLLNISLTYLLSYLLHGAESFLRN